MQHKRSSLALLLWVNEELHLLYDQLIHSCGSLVNHQYLVHCLRTGNEDDLPCIWPKQECPWRCVGCVYEIGIKKGLGGVRKELRDKLIQLVPTTDTRQWQFNLGRHPVPTHVAVKNWIDEFCLICLLVLLLVRKILFLNLQIFFFHFLFVLVFIEPSKFLYVFWLGNDVTLTSKRRRF